MARSWILAMLLAAYCCFTIQAYMVPPPRTPQRKLTSSDSSSRAPLVTQQYTELPQWQSIARTAQKTAATAFIGLTLLLGPLIPSSRPVHALDLKEELAQLSQQVLKQEKLLKMGKKLDARLPNFPTVRNGISLDAATMRNSIERVQTLQAYLDELEIDVYGRRWSYVPGFCQAFAEQENAFLRLVEGLFPTESSTDVSARDALTFEAKMLFLELDNLREAAKFQRGRAAEKAYTKIALAYDRFMKAGDLYKGYDPVTSTERFYAQIPQESQIQYDAGVPAKVTDRGPDKGKTGKLIGLDDTKGIIKLDTNGAFTEVKIISMGSIGKQLQAGG